MTEAFKEAMIEKRNEDHPIRSTRSHDGAVASHRRTIGDSKSASSYARRAIRGSSMSPAIWT